MLSVTKRRVQAHSVFLVSVNETVTFDFYLFLESSADESSEPARKRFALEGTGKIMNSQYNQRNSINYGL
jgi:hypothetical protein